MVLPVPLTDAEVGRYRRDGFLVLRGLLDEVALRRWRWAVDRAVAARDRWLPGRPPIGDDYYQQVFIQRVDLWRTDPEVARLVCDPAFGAVVCRLEGIAAAHLAHDQALYKPPGAHPTALHLDTPYWSFHHRHAATIWIALDDADERSGCLVYLLGSHHTARFETVPIGVDLDALLDLYPEWRALPRVVCPVRAGDAIVHNGLVAHGATANRSGRWRRAVSIGVMPADATYNGNPNVLPSEVAARLEVGAPLAPLHPRLYPPAQRRTTAATRSRIDLHTPQGDGRGVEPR